MTKRKKFREPEEAKAFSWEFHNIANRPKWALCFWAEPDVERLQASKPTSTARHTPVRIIRERDYQRLLRLARRAK